MYKIYFKQAVEMLKQNKFISIITITGTALAIMMIMVIIVSESIKNTSIPPETNRDRTLYLRQETMKRKDGNGTNYNGSINYNTYKTCLSDLKTPELTTLISPAWGQIIVTTPEHEMERVSLNIKFTDDNFWKIMSFNFIEGGPFTKEDFNSGLKKAVLTESTAKKLYGNTSVIGKTVNINFKPYTVTGVVKDVSRLFEFAHSNLFVPYTSIEEYEKNGWFYILFLAKDKSDFGKITEEIRSAERKFNSVDDTWNLTLPGPYNHATQMLAKYSSEEPDTKKNNRKMIFVLSVLLLIPAINLSSFSMSRIKKRTEEIGVRKAFGAKKYVILIQILYENFITSLIGGFIGLLLSYFVVIWLKRWMLDVGSDTAIPIETFISVPVFAAVFIVCMLLNLLSAGIPAYRASKINIVDSLNNNTAKS